MTAPNFLPEDEEEEPLFVESCLEVTPLKLPFLDNVLVMSMAFVDRNPEKLPGMDVRVEDIDAFARITIVTFLPFEADDVVAPPTFARENETLDKVVDANIFISLNEVCYCLRYVYFIKIQKNRRCKRPRVECCLSKLPFF